VSRRGGRTRWARWGWLGACLVVLVQSLVFHHTWVKLSTAPPPEGLLGGTQWGGSPVAREAPPRVFFDNDSYYWIAYTRQMVDEGRWRVRRTELDNAPHGREVHWSSLLAWWIAGLAAAEAAVRGVEWTAAVESAALWANPLLFAVLLGGLAWMWQRRLGSFAAGVLVMLAALLPAMQWDFAYGRPDHHGLHNVAALGLLSGLVLGGGGWVARAGRKQGGGWWLPADQAGRWFAFSGLMGGVGLWVGATQQAMVIGAAGVGALLGMVAARRAGPEGRDGPGFEPRLWRQWGRWGGGSALVFYFVEYFPQHLGQVRLEVNGPLFAVAFLCGGELLCRAGQWLVQGNARAWWRPGSAALWAGCLAYPLAVALGPPAWHAMRDPYMLRLHDYISEFRPLLETQDGAWWNAAARFGPLLLLPPVMLWLLRPLAGRPGVAALLLLPVPAMVFLGGWTLVQARWGGLFASSLLAGLGAVFAVYQLDPARFVPRRAWPTGLGATAGFLLAFWLWPLPGAWEHARLGRPAPQLESAIAVRDVALNLARYGPALGEVRVMSGPSETPTLHHFGRLRGTGALYWENVAGVRDTADFFADDGEDEARRIAAARGIHFVIAQESPALAEYMHWCKHGNTDEDRLTRTLAWRLGAVQGDIPAWLEPVPHYSSPMARRHGLRIYRVRLGTGQLNPAQ
jgi:hypothetical protein